MGISVGVLAIHVASVDVKVVERDVRERQRSLTTECRRVLAIVPGDVVKRQAIDLNEVIVVGFFGQR